MWIKRGLVLILLSSLLGSLSGCATTPTEVAKEKKDNEAARINTELATGYIRRGDLSVAQEKLEKAIKYDRSYVPAYTTLAVLMMMLNQPIEAENLYLEAMDIDPRDPNLQNNYGTFLCGIKKYEEAVEQFEKSLKNQFYKNREVAHANIGYCLLQAENPDFNKVEKHLRKALKRRPNMPSAMLAMAELGLKTNRYLMARAYTQRYHSLTKASAESLWVQIQAEHALGDKKYFLEISQKLLDQFPESDEVDKLMELSNL